MKQRILSLAGLCLATVLSAQAQQDFADVQSGTQQSLEQALQQLAQQREQVAEAKIPLAKELNQLQSKVLDLRREAERSSRLRDARGLDLTSLEADVGARREQIDYISSLTNEYLSSLETRADPAELPSLHPTLDRAFVSLDNPEISQSERYAQQMEAVSMGLTRLREILGGTRVEGEAVTEDGKVVDGTFLIYGPVTYFAGEDQAGLALRGESGRSVVFPMGDRREMIASTIQSGSGDLPVDPTLGKAVAIASTEETLLEHIQKGGFWIYPILGFALVSLAIGLFKLTDIIFVKNVSPADTRKLVKLVREGKREEAIHFADTLPRPGGEMLKAGVENVDEPKELMEEILLEKMTEAQPRLERLLSVIALTAATAPLLGLLGTVTGMINTFKLITIFGTGDAKSLSSGISEALITTEFGLIVAIPSLILHAFLSRQAKGILAKMENTAMTFVNGIYAGRRKPVQAA